MPNVVWLGPSFIILVSTNLKIFDQIAILLLQGISVNNLRIFTKPKGKKTFTKPKGKTTLTKPNGKKTFTKPKGKTTCQACGILWTSLAAQGHGRTSTAGRGP